MSEIVPGARVRRPAYSGAPDSTHCLIISAISAAVMPLKGLMKLYIGPPGWVAVTSRAVAVCDATSG